MIQKFCITTCFKSKTVIFLQRMFTVCLTPYNFSVQGPRGPPGDRGRQGPAGPPVRLLVDIIRSYVNVKNISLPFFVSKPTVKLHPRFCLIEFTNPLVVLTTNRPLKLLHRIVTIHRKLNGYHPFPKVCKTFGFFEKSPLCRHLKIYFDELCFG